MRKLIYVMMVVLLFFGCSAKEIDESTVSEPKQVSKFYLEYDGPTEEGTIINKTNKGLHAYVTYDDGTTEEVLDYSLDKDEELVAGQKTIVRAYYANNKDIMTTLTIECTTPLEVVGLKVLPDHFFFAGDEIDNNSPIKVTLEYSNGTTKITDDWKVETPVVLQENVDNEVVILCEGLSKSILIRPVIPKDLEITYLGPLTEGTTLDIPKSFKVNAIFDDGSSKYVTDFTITKTATLEAEEESTVTIEYRGIKKDFSVMCSSKKIVDYRVEYNGGTAAGTSINNNSSISLYMIYSDGEEEKVYDWSIDEPVTLEADKESTVIIKYNGKEYKLQVQCSTLSEAGYKKTCKKIPYKDLARTPDDYTGERIYFKGEVTQVIEGSGNTVHLRVYTKKGYSIYLDDVIYVEYVYESGEPRILEDDIIEMYGEYYGLYTYTTVMGAEMTIPAMIAEYIDIK